MQISKEISTLETDTKNPKKDLDSLIKQFDTFDICEEKLDDIQKSANTLKDKLDMVLAGYRGLLLENTEYIFYFDDEMTTSKMLGSFQNTKVFKFEKNF